MADYRDRNGPGRSAARTTGRADTRTLREKLTQRLGTLKTERSVWLSEWQEIQQLLVPERGRFYRTDRNRGSRSRRRGDRILNETPCQHLDTLASGMAAGLTTPTQPWFRLTVEDTDIAEAQGVRVWLERAERLMGRIFAKSNFYQSIAELYKELGAFGTAALWQDEDFDTVSRFYPLTAGEYSVGAGNDGRVNVLYREMDMTTEQLAERFGLDSCSLAVRDAYDRGDYDQWHGVCHAIEPYSPRFRDEPRAQRWKDGYVSVYFELGGGSDDKGDKLLSVKGYPDCPVHVPRWSVVLPEAYGWGPGHKALPSIKSLQLLERRAAQAVDHKVNPALQGPPHLSQLDRLPGSYNPVAAGQAATVAPLYDLRAFSLQEAMIQQQQLEQRISRTFYADLFLMMTGLDRRDITATEIHERHEEKLLMLGPVLTRLNDELLNPLIDRTFGMITRASLPFWQRGEPGMLPPPPPELSGADLKVEFLSSLQQAARAVGVLAVEKLASFVGAVAAFDPSAAQKFDSMQAVDDVAERLGVSPRIVRSDDDVAEIHAQQEEAAQRQQQMQMLQGAAQAAGQLGGAKMDGTALGALVQGAQQGGGQGMPGGPA
jgi:Bacteriophage head to tail connecting protein